MFSHAIHNHIDTKHKQGWGMRREQKGEKSSVCMWYVQMHEGQNGLGSMNLGQQTT